MNVPNHIAIILDGNGRWAKAKGMPRSYGHMKGCANLETVCDYMKELGVKYVTVYAFSTENWKRPFFSSLETTSTKDFSTSSTSFLDKFVSFAIAATNSVLFMVFPPLILSFLFVSTRQKRQRSIISLYTISLILSRFFTTFSQFCMSIQKIFLKTILYKFFPYFFLINQVFKLFHIFPGNPYFFV